MPERIQLKRAKGWRLPAGAVIVDRRTRWGNPFVIRRAGVAIPPVRTRMWGVFYDGQLLVRWDTQQLAAADAVDRYRIAARNDEIGMAETKSEIREELASKTLACWCPPGQPCHADVLLELANGGSAR